MTFLQIFATGTFFLCIICFLIELIFDPEETFWVNLSASLGFYLIWFISPFLIYYGLFGRDTYGYIKYLFSRNFALLQNCTLMDKILYLLDLSWYFAEPLLPWVIFYLFLDFLFFYDPSEEDEEDEKEN